MIIAGGRFYICVVSPGQNNLSSLNEPVRTLSFRAKSRNLSIFL
jgi:hypothetical protein